MRSDAHTEVGQHIKDGSQSCESHLELKREGEELDEHSTKDRTECTHETTSQVCS